MIKIDVKAEVADARAGLERLDIETRGIGRKILRALATVAKKRVKKRMSTFLRLGHTVGTLPTGPKGGSLKKGDLGGGLRDAVYGFARSPTHAVVASGQVYKAESRERGATSPSGAMTADGIAGRSSRSRRSAGSAFRSTASRTIRTTRRPRRRSSGSASRRRASREQDRRPADLPHREYRAV